MQACRTRNSSHDSLTPPSIDSSPSENSSDSIPIPKKFTHVVIFKQGEPHCFMSLRGRPDLFPDFIKAQMSLETYHDLQKEPNLPSSFTDGMQTCDSHLETSLQTSKMFLQDGPIEVAVLPELASGFARSAFACIFSALGTYYLVGEYSKNNNFSLIGALLEIASVFTVYSMNTTTELTKLKGVVDIERVYKPLTKKLAGGLALMCGLGGGLSGLYVDEDIYAGVLSIKIQITDD